MFDINIEEIIKIAIKAGKILMQYYNRPIEIQLKTDNSPVTIADLKANEIIIEGLNILTPDINIVSEENEDSVNNLIINDKIFWIIDPLDGTRSFIRKSGSFTVNIALIKDKKPILGVIYAPLTNELYFCNGKKSYKRIDNIDKILLVSASANNVNIISGSSKTNFQIIEHFKKYIIKSVKYYSSSIKFCYIAEGIADIYPRYDNIMEWDTAAGQAIIEQAGGRMLDENGNNLTYAKPHFINPKFIASNGLL